MVDLEGPRYSIRSLPAGPAPLPTVGRLTGDSAGELARIINGDDPVRFVAYIEFLPNGRARGRHVHNRKTEMLYILSGKLEAHYVDRISGIHEVRQVQAGDFITVAPGCAHAYVALERAQALELTAEAFDASDTARFHINLGGDLSD